MKVAIVGAGSVGAALAARLREVGIEVAIGAREPAPGDGTERVADAAASAAIVFLAVPSHAAVEAVRAIGPLGDRVLVDCTNPVGPGLTLADVPEGSIAARITSAFPGARVVKGFNTFGAEFHRDPRIAGTSIDVPIAGDDANAKRLVSELGERAGFRVIDAGPLANARLLEAHALLWIFLAIKGGFGRQIAFKLLAREAP